MTWRPGDLVHLTTERFVVRSAEREDVTDAFLGWLADPDVMVGLNLPRKRFSRPQAVRFVLSHDNQTQFFLVIVCRGDDRPIGFFVVTVDPKHGCAETSVVVGDRDYWGKNVVIETRTAILDFLFDELNVHKVLGRPHGRNVSSIFNYKAMGFECEAVLREQIRSIDGHTRLDQLVFAMLRTQWYARRGKGIAMTAARDTAIEVLAESLGMNVSEVGDDTALAVTSKWDSLAHMRLILALEARLHRRLTPEAIVSITNLRDVISLIDACSRGR